MRSFVTFLVVSLPLVSVFFSLTLCSSLSLSLSFSLDLPLCVLSLFDVSYTPCRCHVSPVSRARSNEMCIGGRSSARLKGRVLRSRDSPGEAGLPDKFQFRAVVQDFRASRTQTNFPSTLFLPCRDWCFPRGAIFRRARIFRGIFRKHARSSIIYFVTATQRNGSPVISERHWKRLVHVAFRSFRGPSPPLNYQTSATAQ